MKKVKTIFITSVPGRKAGTVTLMAGRNTLSALARLSGLRIGATDNVAPTKAGKSILRLCGEIFEFYGETVKFKPCKEIARWVLEASAQKDARRAERLADTSLRGRGEEWVEQVENSLAQYRAREFGE